ncbi:Dfp1/Him1, central region-domain-containing protein [Mycena metata]|uniref:Dfp1/Him1, central region-domain-containing protein n=1 Tax=Mycena metata TaxID=1033252 RepID=A0AAD7P068_9AGAR|nr:Dfp1/Him1, central region-domain-containing protein [Mycena metata]
MATLRRTHPPLKQARSVSGSKRPRSPDQSLEVVPKRLKATASAGPAHRDKDHDRDKARKAERDQQKLEFREKYRKAFPGWKFYFDEGNIHSDNHSAIKLAQTRIRKLGATVELYFSTNITHLITDQPVPPDPPAIPSADKENDAPRSKLKSPIKLKGLAGEDTPTVPYDLVSKTKTLESAKIWSMSKLQSVLERCIDNPPAPAAVAPPAPAQRSLSRLLQSERINGTSERDPTQKRHDYKYFGRGTYFMMVEDLRSQLATVAVQEYIIPKGREANARVPWPVLHCHPHARGPFLPFDEKEKKRWEKTQRLELQQAGDREKQQDKVARVEAMKRKAEARLQVSNQTGDLRRSVSMNNMHRRVKLEEQLIDLDGDVADSTNASGYLPRGYVAASGNSVGITSTTGTTSTAGFSFRTSTLPPSSRRVNSPPPRPRTSKWVPPSAVPERRPMLKKSRSTNTMRLPKRDEGSKPGYCECCRMKFDDFTAHIAGRKHRKFALDDESKQEQLDWERSCAEHLSGGEDEDESEAQSQDSPEADYDMFDGALVDLDS